MQNGNILGKVYFDGKKENSFQLDYECFSFISLPKSF